MAPFFHSQFTRSLVSHKQNQEKITSLGFTIFFTGVLYYCFAYLLRVYPNIMAGQLLERFHTTAIGYSFLIVFYYIAYAPLQIPVGVTVDKIGPRRSLIVACLISMMGVLLFASAKWLTVALLGRLLVGAGAAFAYVTALKLATTWLPKRYFATATGFVTGFGMLAAGLTEIGFTHLLEQHGYLTALRTPLYIGIILFILILFIVKDKPNSDKQETEKEEVSAMSYIQLWRYVKLIMSNRQMWLIGTVGCLLYLPSSVFLDAWTIPYLKSAYHFTAFQAADGASTMLIGWITSSFLAGFLSDILGTRKIPLLIACASTTIISSILIFSSHLSVTQVFTLLFLFGIACGPHPLCFTLSKENWSKKVAGTAVAFANFIIMMGGFLLQPVVGWLLNLSWQHTFTAAGVRLYTAYDYVDALMIIPFALFIATILAFFIEETYKRTKDESQELDRKIHQLINEQNH